MKTIAFFAVLFTVFCFASFAQEPEQTYLWTEKVQLQAGQTLDLVQYIEAKEGNGFFASSEDPILFQVNSDTKTSRVGFCHNSTVVVTALVDFELTIYGVQ